MTSVLSYNVNGIRAAARKGFLQWLQTQPADIVCLQEVKAQQTDFDCSVFYEMGYTPYWFAAEKKGYSGVCILAKRAAKSVFFGQKKQQSDAEGRVIQAEFENFLLVNTYFPSGSSGELRQTYKMVFLHDYLQFVRELQQTYNRLVLVGDYNICHQAIDIHDPVGNQLSSGFLPEERAWMDHFFAAGFVDAFRALHPQTAHVYSWWSYRAGARARNKGWRIDYINVSENLRPHIVQADILTDVCHSDHCPVIAYLDVAH